MTFFEVEYLKNDASYGPWALFTKGRKRWSVIRRSY